MTHAGPPTMVLKRWQAMQAAAAAVTNAETQPAVPRIALLPSVYDDPSSPSSAADEQPLISYGDTEMKDASSTQDDYSHSHTTFSPEAKPFVPPSVKAPPPTPSAMAAPRRPAPHHRLHGRGPVHAVPAIPASPSSAPVVKAEPPASPSISVRSHRPGPHTKLRPHAPPQPEAPVTVQTSPADVQNVLVNLQQSPESDQEHWVTVQEPPQVEAGSWVDLHGLDVKAGPETAGTAPPSSHVDSASVPQISEVAVSAEHSSGSDNIASALENGDSAQTNTVPDKMTNNNRRFDRNEWLPMLLGMNDTDKGRQLIRAFTDPICATLGTSEAEGSNTEKDLLMEFADGQCYHATVHRDTTISEMTKAFAEMVKLNESDISVVLKVRVVEDQIN